LNFAQFQPVWWKSLLLVPLAALTCVLGFGLPAGFGPFITVALAMLYASMFVWGAYFALGLLYLARAVAPDATRGVRLRRLFLSVCLLGGLVLLWPAFPMARGLRTWSSQRILRAVPREAAPLVAALERYREDHEEYPPSLQALVPTHLDEIPASPIGVDREFDYERSDRAPEWRSVATQPRPAYELSVQFGMWAGFRNLRYWPSQDYPEKIDGQAVLALVDGWGYVDG
jgi:hypothetical protein